MAGSASASSRKGVWQLSNSVVSPSTDVSVDYGHASDRPLIGNWGSRSQMFGSTPAPLRSFFPIAVDFQPPARLRTWAGRGINTAIRVPHGTDTESWTRAANAAGLKMIREPRANPALDALEPNLLAFTGPDEPELNGCNPDCVLAQRRELKAAAPTKPYLLNLAGLSVAFPAMPHDNLFLQRAGRREGRHGVRRPVHRGGRLGLARRLSREPGRPVGDDRQHARSPAPVVAATSAVRLHRGLRLRRRWPAPDRRAAPR